MIDACIKCGDLIPEGRREVLPSTETCVRCSTVVKHVGFQIYAHKTAGEVMIVPGDDAEGVRQARAVYLRTR
jgi:hypothetical protein